MDARRRLRPLLLANFFSGLMFYWSILFPFMDQQGVTTSQLSIYVIVTNTVIILLEVPSGILADRWSRKKVLMIGLISIAIAAVILGTADSFGQFVVGAVFASVYFALNSGMQQAIIYDVMLENNSRGDYEKQFGRAQALHGIGIVIASIIGAIMASELDFAVPFYVSLISIALSLYYWIQFKEPVLHRQVETEKLISHISALFRAINKHRSMQLLVITSVFVNIEFIFMTELDQLWPIALGLATIWYGPLNALLMSSMAFSPAAAKLAKQPRYIMVLVIALVTGSLGLLIQNIFVVAFSEFALLTSATVLCIILSGKIQDELPSSQRSGVESAVSTIATIAFIAATFLFTYIVDRSSVFMAAWIIIAIACVAAVGVYRSLFIKQSASA